jgi:hypothetical protein
LSPKLIDNEFRYLDNKQQINLSIIIGINFFLLQLYLSNINTAQTLKWISHISLMLFVLVIYILLKFNISEFFQHKLFYRINLILLMILTSISMREISSIEDIEIIKFSLFITGIFLFLIFTNLVKIGTLGNLQFITITFLTTFSFLLLPNGKSLLNIESISNRKIVLVFFTIFVSLVLWRLMILLKEETFKYLSLLTLAPNLLLSFRNDQFDRRDGSFFHISYFSEVIRTLKSGGTLLWDTPSQYGFLSVLVPTWLPFQSSRQAFYFWQAIVTFVFLLAVYFFLSSVVQNKKQLFYGYGVFSLLYFFSDPALIGPQPFPSSSTMRFGPSVILLIFIIYIKGKNKLDKRNFYTYYIFLLILCNLWSAESLIYGVVISGFFAFTQLLNKEKAYLIIAPVIALLLSFLLMNIYTLLEVKKYADLRMYFMYSQSYSEGYGSLPLTIFSPLIVLYVIIFGTAIWCVFSQQPKKLDLIFLILLTNLIWVTYYLGRAVSNNIMVLFPLFFLSMFTMYVYSTSLNNYKVYTLKATNIVFVPLFVISLILTPNLFNTISKISFGVSTLNPITNVVFDAEVQRKLELISSDQVVYSSWAAGIPLEFINRDFSSAKSPLPVPLQLLEEPISPELASTIVSRFVSDTTQEIYFVQSKDNEHERRLKYWLEILGDRLLCKQEVLNSSHSVLKCSIT